MCTSAIIIYVPTFLLFWISLSEITYGCLGKFNEDGTFLINWKNCSLKVSKRGDDSSGKIVL